MIFFHRHLQLALLISLRSAASTCFYPDGSLVTSNEFQPCNLVANSVSMCCATNRPHQFADECLSNGLCFNPCGVDGFCGGSDKGQYWRESCTDQSWKSPQCLKSLCTNPTVSQKEPRAIGRWGKLTRTERRTSQRHDSHVAMLNRRQLVLRRKHRL